MKKSLGLIETQGLAAGIEAADAAVKSANVELIGYELTRGGGWTTVKVQGDVGAVKAAVDAARMAAAKVNRVVSTRVIPRPSAGLDMLVHNPDTVGDAQAPKGPDMPKPPTPPKCSEKVKEEEKLPEEPEGQGAEQIKETQPDPVPEKAEVESEKVSEVENPKEAEPESVEAPVEEAEKTESSEAEVPTENSDEVKPENVETPVEETKDAESPETKEEETSPEQEPQETVVPKPAKRAASKGRKGGKRNNKQEPAE